MRTRGGGGRLDSSQTNNFCVHIMFHDWDEKKNVPFGIFIRSTRCFACFFHIHTARVRFSAPFEITRFIGFYGVINISKRVNKIIHNKYILKVVCLQLYNGGGAYKKVLLFPYILEY